MSSADERRGALAAVDRILNRGGDPDDVLQGVLDILHGSYRYAAIAFLEDGELQTGPALGEAGEPRASLDVAFRDAKVAELHVSPPPADAEERAFLERVTVLISPYCLVGWDTGGEPWDSA